MWLALKALLLRWVLGRSVGGLLSILLMLAVPLAGVLKVIGLPILIVLGVVGFPILMLLMVIGLPILLVVGIVSVLMTVVGAVLAAGVALLKIALPVILIFLVLRWVVRGVRGRNGRAPGTPRDVPPPPPPAPPPPPPPPYTPPPGAEPAT